MRYLKWLNLIPLIMFFIVDQLRGTLISRYLLIIIVALGVMNMFLAKSMKEYVISSLMLVASTLEGKNDAYRNPFRYTWTIKAGSY